MTLRGGVNRGHLQVRLEYGLQNDVSILPGGLAPMEGLAWDSPLYLKVFAADQGKDTQVAVEAYTGSDYATNQVWYGRDVGSFPLEITLYLDGVTKALGDQWPPSLSEGENETEQAVLTVQSAEEGVPAIYYLEWFGNMVSQHAKAVKTQIDGMSWSETGEAPDNIVLSLDDSLDRHKLRSYLKNRLILIHSQSEEEPEPEFSGGHGREGRKAVCFVTAILKTASGINSSKEEYALELLEQMMDDLKAEFRPSGVPNLLNGYVYYSKFEPQGGPFSLESVGVDAVARTVKISGYKHEVA